MKRTVFLLAVSIIFLVFQKSTLAQYYFGKNKVQYTHFEWQVLKTSHFEVYFYVEEKELAEIAAQVAEESYNYLSDKFNHTINNKRIPLIIYSSPNYFEQTNVIPNILPENVAGFTEFFKGRMVIPFDGSYSSFARVIRHELVHTFTTHKLIYVARTHKKFSLTEPPLWFQEGLADFWSKEWDSQADMILRDMVISGNLINLNNIGQVYGTYLMYKIGQSFCKFLSERYGDYKLTQIFDDYWKGDDFEEVIEVVFRKSLARLNEEWEYALKKKYFPVLSRADLPNLFSSQLTFDGFNVAPQVFTQTIKGKKDSWVAFKSDRLGYSSICLMSARGEKEQFITLIKGERSSEFESLHLLKSRLDISSKGAIAFVSKFKERDVLYIYDTGKMEVKDMYRFDSLVALSSPSWSPTEEKLVFSGITKAGYADLYILDLQSTVLERLTNDVYEDKEACFHPGGEKIVFVSDRNSFGADGYLNLYELDLNTNAIVPLTYGQQNDRTPCWSSDGKNLVFSSDQDGISNLYTLDKGGNLKKLTNVATGVFEPEFTPDGKGIVYSAYKDFRFQIYHLPFYDSAAVPVPPDMSEYKKTFKVVWNPPRLNADFSKGEAKYENHFSFDIAQSAVAYDAFYGPVGGFQVALTDMLGNHQYIFLLGNTARSNSDFFSSFNAGVTYINKTNRLNYGYGIFHFYDEYYDRINGDYSERQYGGLGFTSYPVSKFQRLEAILFLRQSDRNRFFLDQKRRAFLYTQYLSLIKDTSLWDLTGPLDGTRFNLTVGVTTNLKTGKMHNNLVLADIRRYFRLGKNSAFATRWTAFSSNGVEPQRLYLGGSWTLRGYDRRAFFGRHLVLISNELRFPLVNNLLISFPFGKLGFEGIRGAIFFDAGNAWDEDFQRFYGSFGIGARVALGYVAVLRFDVAKKTDFSSISKKTVFDFFFGWNF